ncbi:flightin isoform X2 [Arctopsyche grandis]|uniref:flightin isoform X2 n=1 Tax=Arctopsyche grandis TaxID=121162 RepID=UPI00406D99EF
MFDEPWEIEDPSLSEAPAEVVPEATEAAPEAPAPAPEPEPEPVATELPRKKLIFQHWVRPKFLQYNYMYEYRHNYYDDVIDFLDRRQRGLARELPRAQTWAERAMRTAAHRQPASAVSCASRQDAHLLSHVSTAARFHRYHSKSLISRKIGLS